MDILNKHFLQCGWPAFRLSRVVFTASRWIQMYLVSTSTSKTNLGLTSKAIFSQGGWRSEVRDGSVSQLPPFFPVPDAPYQRQEKKRGGAQLFKRVHVWLDGGGDKTERSCERASEASPLLYRQFSAFFLILKLLGIKFQNILLSMWIKRHINLHSCMLRIIYPTTFLCDLPVNVFFLFKMVPFLLFSCQTTKLLYQLTGWTQNTDSFSLLSTLIKTQPLMEIGIFLKIRCSFLIATTECNADRRYSHSCPPGFLTLCNSWWEN